MHSSCNGRQRHIHIHLQVRCFSLLRLCLYTLKGWFAFILPFKACSCNFWTTVKVHRLLTTLSDTECMRSVQYGNFFFLPQVHCFGSLALECWNGEKRRKRWGANEREERRASSSKCNIGLSQKLPAKHYEVVIRSATQFLKCLLHWSTTCIF